MARLRMSDPTAYLLAEIDRVKRDNDRLRWRLRSMRCSRDFWKAEARAWRWGSQHGCSVVSTASTALSPTERAEAS